MLSKKYKLAKKEDFNLLYNKGSLLQSPHFKIFILPNNLGYSRFSVTASKKNFPKAINRNTLKRRIKHATALLLPNFPIKADLLIIAQKITSNLSGNSLIKNLEILLKKYTL